MTAGETGVLTMTRMGSPAGTRVAQPRVGRAAIGRHPAMAVDPALVVGHLVRLRVA